jgi:hypothetical protein
LRRVVCWFVDHEGLQPGSDLEEFLVDRLGAGTGRTVVEPSRIYATIRSLGSQHLHVYDAASMARLAASTEADWVVWVKRVSRDVRSKRGLSIPYLLNRRRLDTHVFYDVRIYDRERNTTIGSKRLTLSEKGESTWQIVDDEKLDPVYRNDAVALHERDHNLAWRGAAAISGYCVGVWSEPRSPQASSAATHPRRPERPRKPENSEATSQTGGAR